ncbi:hypothetical protein NQ318_012601 [Aromia moschata]|uniref:Uncharacterized protein n=1 Tax=Aromia moschata TaxID=1265417 RepID=A0AAV8YMB7_9CUCU|nr:hypothetical protein NQ318_012601 [Aromia moschata]
MTVNDCRKLAYVMAIENNKKIHSTWDEEKMAGQRQQTGEQSDEWRERDTCYDMLHSECNRSISASRDGVSQNTLQRPHAKRSSSRHTWPCYSKWLDEC